MMLKYRAMKGRGKKMDYKLLMRTAICAGELSLKSGAETYRAEDTMTHILKTSGCSYIEVHATITGIMATLWDEKMDEPITMISRMKERGTHLYKIVQVNDISRRYCGGDITLEEAYDEIQKIGTELYRQNSKSISIMLVVTGFTLMFGGGWIEILASLIVGGALAVSVRLCSRLLLNVMIQDIISAFILAGTAVLLKEWMMPVMHLDTVIIGAIMPLVPGVAITNAVRDTLQGDYVSGCARILEAFLRAASIAIGAGVAMALLNF